MKSNKAGMIRSLFLGVFAVILSAGLVGADEYPLCEMVENGNLSAVKHLLSNGE